MRLVHCWRAIKLISTEMVPYFGVLRICVGGVLQFCMAEPFLRAATAIARKAEGLLAIRISVTPSQAR